jgi:SDR family mycofactocin-dependent oxidoreductase
MAMGRVEGKVAFITGAARGQGRSHAVRLAEEGADIIAIDICGQMAAVPYPMGTPEDLAETVKLVENLDRRILGRQVDVRDLAAIESVVAEGVADFGRLDIVCANAGIANMNLAWETTEEQWQANMDVNLTGVWKTVKAAIPRMIEFGNGGSIILTSSIAGFTATAELGGYVAAKHGVTGLARALAVELAPYNIRCNSVHPGIVSTDIIHNDAFYEWGGILGASREQAERAFARGNALPNALLQSIDISNAVLWLASEEARYVTGTAHVVDSGVSAPFKIPQR